MTFFGHRLGILCFNCWYVGCTALCPELLDNRPLPVISNEEKRRVSKSIPRLNMALSIIQDQLSDLTKQILRLALITAKEDQWGGVGTGCLFCQVSTFS